MKAASLNNNIYTLVISPVAFSWLVQSSLKLVVFVLLVMSSSALLAQEPKLEMHIEPLVEGVYVHKSYKIVEPWGKVSSNGLVVVDGAQAFLIDTPWSVEDTRSLLQWLADKGLTLMGSISTHFHEDRTAGIAWLNAKNIPTYAHGNTNSLLAEINKPLAKNGFDGAVKKLWGNRLEVFYPGGGHSPDNVVVYIPRHNLLFGGCFVRSLKAKGLGNLMDAVVPAWPKSLSKVVTRYPKIELVVPGHGKSGNLGLLEHTVNLVRNAAVAKK